MKEKNNVISRSKVGDKINNTSKESQTILQFFTVYCKSEYWHKNINKFMYRTCNSERKTYSIMDDTGFKKILDPVFKFNLFLHIFSFY
jgi:hypothetical protein